MPPILDEAAISALVDDPLFAQLDLTNMQPRILCRLLDMLSADHRGEASIQYEATLPTLDYTLQNSNAIYEREIANKGGGFIRELTARLCRVQREKLDVGAA